MGSESPVKLPTVDFTKIKTNPGSPEWESAKLQVMGALEEYGCFEAVYDEVTVELRKGVYWCLKELFDLPLETKTLNKSPKPFHGYVGPQPPGNPLYESMGIDNAQTLEDIENFADIMWPAQGHPIFCETMHSYFKNVIELDKMVRRMVFESLGVEKYLSENIASHSYHSKLIKYKKPGTDETKLAHSPHLDANTMTIISQNQVGGLEVQTKDGAWIAVNLSPNSFAVMIGQSFRALINGRFHVPIHRVMMKGNEERYATGVFAYPRGGCLVKAPEELVDEQHPLLFKPYDYYEFINFIKNSMHKGTNSDLEAHCGI